MADVPDFATLDEGWYQLEIAKVGEEKKDKNNDKFFSVEFNVDGQNAKAWDVFYTEKEDRLWKLKNFLKQIDENLCDIEFDGEKELVGKKVIAHILPPSKGETLPKIREYVSVDHANPEDLKKGEDDDLPF